MLLSRNVTVGALRTSMRLEPEFWAALVDIARMENLSLDALCSRIDARRGTLARTAAIRLFATAYFGIRRAAGADAPNVVEAVFDEIAPEPVKRRLQA